MSQPTPDKPGNDTVSTTPILPLISIIIPLYNREKYILETLTSIKEQTYRNFEIILINDGSTDDSAKIAELFLRKNNLSGLLHTIKNSGPDYARDIGVDKSSGDLIALLDSDDLWRPNYLEMAILAFSKATTNNMVFFTDFNLMYDDGRKSTLKSDDLIHFNTINKNSIGNNLWEIIDDLFLYLLTEQPIFIGCVVFSRKTIDTVGDFCKVIPERGLSVEWEYFLRCANRKTQWFFCDMANTTIRKHSDNMSGITSAQVEGEVFVLKRILSEYSLNKEQKKSINHQIAIRSFGIGYSYFHNHKYPQARKFFLSSVTRQIRLKSIVYIALTFLPKKFILTLKKLT